MLNQKSSVWLQISAGQGPVECALAVTKVLTRIQAEAFEGGLDIQVLQQTDGNRRGTLISVIIRVSGSPMEPFLTTWLGTIQWRCTSPYRPRHRRKNWFVAVEEIPPLADGVIRVEPHHIHWQTTRSSGPGGQHVNKTETAVQALHRPSGLRVTASEARSQLENKKLAIEKLKAMLAAGAQRKRVQHVKGCWQNHNHLERGNPVRVFRDEAFIPC